MRIGPFTISRTKSGGDLITSWPLASGSWWPIVRESFAGSWQRRITIPVDDAATHPTFWACITLIAGDIAKMRVKLVSEDPTTGICDEVTNPAYSPVLRKPNHYQNRIQFYTYWILSKLTRGNAYALKERDGRGVISALYLLDPMRVRPLISPDGEVYYSLQHDPLSGLQEPSLIVPAREIIHDTMFALYHPLVGLSPIYACGHAAMQGLQIVNNTTKLFEHGSHVGGIITAPGQISPEMVKRIERRWESEYAGPHNIGKIAVLGDGLKFEQTSLMSAVDAQLIDQLKWGDEKVCATFHVPGYMVGVGSAPSYNNVEALNQQYYSQCLQVLIESLELCLDEGLELNDPLGIEFDLDGLLRMDSATKMKSATDGVKGGVYTPNEAREIFNLPPKQGGDTVYLQQQDFSIAALDRRDQAAPAPPSMAPKPESNPAAPAPQEPKGLSRAQRKALVVGKTALLMQQLADAA